MIWGWRLWGLCGFIRLPRPEIHLLRCRQLPLSRDHARVLWAGLWARHHEPARISFYASWSTLNVKATGSASISMNYNADRAGWGIRRTQHMSSGICRVGIPYDGIRMLRQGLSGWWSLITVHMADYYGPRSIWSFLGLLPDVMKYDSAIRALLRSLQIYPRQRQCRRFEYGMRFAGPARLFATV